MLAPFQAAAPPSFLSAQVTSASRFYHCVPAEPVADLTVVCGGWEECALDYAIDRESFPYYSIEFVAAGEGELCLDGRLWPLQPGTVFSYGPGIKHRIGTSPAHRLRKYFVDFVGTRALALMRQCDLGPGGAVQLPNSTEFREAFDALIRRAHLQKNGASRLCALQLEVLLLLATQPAAPSVRSDRRSLATFERCRRQIDAEFLHLHTIEEAAQCCHVDVSYLCRLFRRFQGEKPLRYLQRLQMHWAAQRLRNSGCLIREVADELGVEAFQFSRTFKRLHGVSPSALLSATAHGATSAAEMEAGAHVLELTPGNFSPQMVG